MGLAALTRPTDYRFPTAAIVPRIPPKPPSRDLRHYSLKPHNRYNRYRLSVNPCRIRTPEFRARTVSYWGSLAMWLAPLLQVLVLGAVGAPAGGNPAATAPASPVPTFHSRAAVFAIPFHVHLPPGAVPGAGRGATLRLRQPRRPRGSCTARSIRPRGNSSSAQPRTENIGFRSARWTARGQAASAAPHASGTDRRRRYHAAQGAARRARGPTGETLVYWQVEELHPRPGSLAHPISRRGDNAVADGQVRASAAGGDGARCQRRSRPLPAADVAQIGTPRRGVRCRRQCGREPDADQHARPGTSRLAAGIAVVAVVAVVAVGRDLDHNPAAGHRGADRQRHATTAGRPTG